MTNATDVIRRGRPFGFLLLGICAAVTAAFVVFNLSGTVPFNRWLYTALYRILGPDGADRVAISAGYTVGVLTTASAPVGLALALDSPPHRESMSGKVAIGQLAIITVLSVAILLVPFGALPLGLIQFGLFVGLAFYWERDSVDADAVATLAGGAAVVTLLVLYASVVGPLAWNSHTVVANATDADVTVDGDTTPITDVFSASSTQCGGNGSGSWTCSLDGSPRLYRILDRHGVRCPYEAGVSRSAVIIQHDNSTYRVRCRTYGD